MNFQFKPLPIDIIHHTRISALRERMRQKKKALILALISFYRWTDSVRKVPQNTLLKGKVPPDPTIFIIFCGKNSPDFQMPQNPIIFAYSFGKYCPGPVQFSSAVQLSLFHIDNDVTKWSIHMNGFDYKYKNKNI